MSPRPPRRGRTPNRAGAAFALIFCVGGGAFNLWLVITKAELQGGFPLISAALNQLIGRVFLSVCALLCFGLAVLAARDLRASRDSDDGLRG